MRAPLPNDGSIVLALEPLETGKKPKYVRPTDDQFMLIATHLAREAGGEEQKRWNGETHALADSQQRYWNAYVTRSKKPEERGCLQLCSHLCTAEGPEVKNQRKIAKVFLQAIHIDNPISETQQKRGEKQ